MSLWIEKNGIETLHNTDETMEIAALGAAGNGDEALLPVPVRKTCPAILKMWAMLRKGIMVSTTFLSWKKKQTIMALGAGTIPRPYTPDGRIERCDNVKDVALYMEKLMR